MYSNWSKLFLELDKQDFYKKLINFINSEYENKTIYPEKHNVFNAFKLTKPKDIKVVIIGQDPYPNPNQAIGLAFAVNKDIKLPPSLINIYREIENEFGKKFVNKDGDLTYLAKQGVLLLNSILTVEQGKPLSHDIPEYRIFFKYVMEFIDSLNQPIVFMLWGNSAKQYEKYIKNPNHYVLKANHPSPLSANRGGWFGANVFINCNKILKENNINEINWLK